jgi:hypothetical protein
MFPAFAGEGGELVACCFHGEFFEEVEEMFLGDAVGGQEVDAFCEDTLPIGLWFGTELNWNK